MISQCSHLHNWLLNIEESAVCHYLLHISFSSPHAFWGPASLACVVHFIDLALVHVDAADLHVDILLNVL